MDRINCLETSDRFKKSLLAFIVHLNLKVLIMIVMVYYLAIVIFHVL